MDEAKYLGVTISHDLQWSSHIQQITAKSNCMLGLLRRNLSRCPLKLREQAYFALIRSRLEYCSAVWDPHRVKDSKLLENVQRRSARFVCQNHDPYASVSSMLQDLHWLALKDRRRDIRLALFYQIVKGKVEIPAEDYLLKADTRTRSHNSAKFRHFATHCEQYKHSFFVTTIPQWNTLPEASVSADTVTAFKASLCPNP